MGNICITPYTFYPDHYSESSQKEKMPFWIYLHSMTKPLTKVCELGGSEGRLELSESTFRQFQHKTILDDHR